MAAINIQPRMQSTSTGSATGAVTHTYTVPANRRWLFDVIEIEFSVANAGNTADIQFDQDGGGAPVNIYPRVGNFLKMRIDLSSVYPRAPEAEASDQIEIVFARAVATTAVSRVYLIERDI